jgi:hypothetical protein
MKKWMMIWVMAFPVLSVMAQRSDIRVPFRSAMKMGVIDGNEVQIVPPIYDNVAINSAYQLILLNKDGLWGIFDWKGKMILDHTISATGQGYNGRPEIKPVKNGNQEFSGMSTTGLLCVIDLFANVRYYVNPNAPLKTYKAYGNKNMQVDFNTQNIDYTAINNLFMVGNRGLGVSFIDSTGAEIVTTVFEDGQILNANCFTARKDGKFALFFRNKQLTSHLYENKFYRSEDHAFYVNRRWKDSSNNSFTYYYLFNKDGIIMDSSTYVPLVYNKGVLMNHNPGFVVHDTRFQKKNSHPNYNGEVFNLGKQYYILTSFNGKQGLMTLEGGEIFKPECSINKYYSDRQISIISNEKAVLLDSTLVPVFEMDSVTSLSPTLHKDVYMFGKKRSWQTLYGLIDDKKAIVEKPDWSQISLADCNDLAVLKTDSTTVVKNIAEDKVIVSASKEWRVLVDCRSSIIQKLGLEKIIINYDFSGKLLDSFSESQRRDLYQFGPHKYKSEEVNKKKKLVNKEGKQALAALFEDIEMVYDIKTKQSIYMCQTAKNTHPSAVVYNDQLKVITPVGYSMPADWYRYMDENPGTLCVVNDADVAKNKYSFRFGICDYGGNWIVPPFVGTFKYIEPGLFILHYYEEKKVKFYDIKGNKTCDEDFLMIEKGHGSDFFQNRILVGVVKDPNYMKKVESLNLEKLEMEVAVEKLKALGEPDMLYGYLNKRGKKVLDLKYRKAQPFPMRGITTTVAVEKDGKLVSQVIDTSGTILFEGEFDEMEFIDSIYYKVKKEGKWALANHQGVVLTPYQFEEIYFESRGKYFKAEGGGERFIISMDYRILNLGKYYNALIQKLNGLYVVKLITQETGSYHTTEKFVLYDEDFGKRAEILDAKGIEGEYQNLRLPSGYVLVKKDYLGKDAYLFDVNRNKSLWK